MVLYRQQSHLYWLHLFQSPIPWVWTQSHIVLWAGPQSLCSLTALVLTHRVAEFFFLTSLLEYNCFTTVCYFLLYNRVNQLYINICPHISSLSCLPPTLPISPLLVVTKHGADLPVLCSCFPPAIYFTFGSVYMSMPLSHFVPAYPSPTLCPQVHSLCKTQF